MAPRELRAVARQRGVDMLPPTTVGVAPGRVARAVMSEGRPPPNFVINLDDASSQVRRNSAVRCTESDRWAAHATHLEGCHER